MWEFAEILIMMFRYNTGAYSDGRMDRSLTHQHWCADAR